MATGTVMPVPQMQFLDSDGNPLSGGKLYTYAAGGTVNLATYSDSTLSSANANPVVLDAAGRAVVYLQAKAYKFKLDNSSDVQQWVQNNVNAVPYQVDSVDITATAGESLAIRDVCFLSDGQGSLTAGKWYKAEANLNYTSTDATLGIATAAISADATGTVRLVGTVDGFTSLTVGDDYFIHTTAGEITRTQPTRPRQVGRAMAADTLLIAFAPARSDLFLGPVCNGRISLESGAPVSTADQTAKTSVYFVPYHGNKISLYNTDTTLWTVHEFSELTFSLSGLTADRNYDLYVYSVNGVVTIDDNGLTTWGSSNDTSRQPASVLESQDGVWVKKDAHNYRYLGTIRTTDTEGQCEDSYAKRLVWNAYNQVDRALRYLPVPSGWLAGGATIQQAKDDTAYQIECVSGRDDNAITVDNWLLCSVSTAAADTYMAVGIGESSTTANATGTIMQTATPAVADFLFPSSAHLKKNKSEGYHYYTMLESNTEPAGVTLTWFSISGDATRRQGGISAIFRM